MQLQFPTANHLKYYLQILAEEEAKHLPKFADQNFLAYFESFDKQHGGEPVVYAQERLLYRDGWQYNLKDYAGPEYEPPTDPTELKKLRLAYWSARRTLATDELLFLKKELAKLTALQSTKSLPLKIFKREADPITQKRETVDLNLQEIQDRVQWLADDCIDSDKHLRELEGSAD